MGLGRPVDRTGEGGRLRPVDRLLLREPVVPLDQHPLAGSVPLVCPARQRALQHDAPVVVRVLRSKGFGVGAGHHAVVGDCLVFRPDRRPVLVKRGITKTNRDHGIGRKMRRARAAVEAAAVR